MADSLGSVKTATENDYEKEWTCYLFGYKASYLYLRLLCEMWIVKKAKKK